jgi:hypothetical protein
MLIYNVTAKITPQIHTTWVQWMKDKHIPAVMKTGCFTGHRFARLLDVDDSEGPTYVIQYFAENREDYERYIAEHASVLRKDVFDNWGANFVAFRSLMEVVN